MIKSDGIEQSNYNVHSTQFTSPSSGIELKPGDTHVYHVKIDLPEIIVREYETLLSPQEKMRATRFHFKRDRNRYIVGRGLLKKFLARYLKTTPGKIWIRYSKNGKPFLFSARANENVQFNLSHSEDCALYAFTYSDAIGVDIEKIQDFPGMLSIAKRFFSDRECEMINALPRDDQITTFYTFWTSMEAIAKLTGNGLRQAVEKHEVGSSVRKKAYSPRSVCTPTIHSRYFTQDLYPRPDFVAAIAAFREFGRVFCWQYTV